jgi:hypothetical protein
MHGVQNPGAQTPINGVGGDIGSPELRATHYRPLSCSEFLDHRVRRDAT